MPPPPVARSRLLDAFIQILVEQGERSATLESVAAAAGVSKGGLLYHFASKNALVDALARHVEQLGATDAEAMRAAPEGPAVYYVRTSNYEDTPLDRAIVATTRLSQGADPRARQALHTIRDGWMRAMTTEIPDPITAQTIMLIGDGLYYNAANTGAPSLAGDVEIADLLAVVDRIVAR